MRVLLPLFFLATTACKATPILHSAPPEPRFHWESPGLFVAFVPSGEELQLLDEGRLAVSSQRAFSLDHGRLGTRATELHQKCTTDHLLDVVRWKKGLVWLRSDKYGNLQLDADLGAGAEPFPRPDNAMDLRGLEGGFGIQSPAPRLAADGDVLVLITAPWIQRREHDVWTSVRLDLGSEKLLDPPGRALLVDRKLWLGVDKGEWGGQLIVADIDTGHAELECRKWQNGPWNVSDIDRGPDGTIYVTCGVAQLGAEDSALMAFDGERWSRVLWSSAKNIGRIELEPLEDADEPQNAVRYTDEERIALVRRSIVRAGGETSVASADFRALAFDQEGRLCLLTSWLGLLRREANGDWHWLTPGWPRSGVWVTDLAMVGGKAVITAPAAGVIVVDLDTLAADRVRL